MARLRAPDAFEAIAHACGELVQVAGAAFAVAIVVAKTPATPIPAAIEDTQNPFQVHSVNSFSRVRGRCPGLSRR